MSNCGECNASRTPGSCNEDDRFPSSDVSPIPATSISSDFQKLNRAASPTGNYNSTPSCYGIGSSSDYFRCREQQKKLGQYHGTSYSPTSTSFSSNRLRSCDVYIGFHGRKPLLLRFTNWLRAELEVQGVSCFVTDRARCRNSRKHKIIERAMDACKKNLVPVYFDLGPDDCLVRDIVERRGKLWEKHGGELWLLYGGLEKEWKDAVSALSRLIFSLKQKLGVKAPPVRIDSQAKYGALSRGDGAIYLRFPHNGYREKIWDHAAGAIVVTVREVWPRSLERINLVEPSQSMQRAGQSLIKNLKNLPLIHSYDSIQSLTKNINKSERDHDLVIASYVLGEIPSQQDRITIVPQLWDLTQDVLEDICEPNRQKSKIQPIMMWALEYDPDMFSVHEDPDSVTGKSEGSRGKAKSTQQCGKYKREKYEKWSER
ncbi:hypothetical protein RHGRI_019419 [Rhododendron griersonianum]|uniref:TIR domain-containing protein n=1 Tax=Rhododendron griersonianum TaxID=479676 RepID=A0AAV6JGV8_9ERIC|nr:hypothetical protein RHGRI_019419 [Rhododendron griersonianum]KAG5538870.1 hypothetical protein RHGRI_019419 [Rhododendron griersonianum]